MVQGWLWGVQTIVRVPQNMLEPRPGYLESTNFICQLIQTTKSRCYRQESWAGDTIERLIKFMSWSEKSFEKKQMLAVTLNLSSKS